MCKKQVEEVWIKCSEVAVDGDRDVVLGGKPWGPDDASRKAAQEKDTCSWIPGPVAAVAPLPLSPGELADLFPTNASVSREDENELSGHLPELHDLPGPEEFDAAVNEQNRLGMEDLDFRSDLFQSQAPQGSADDLQTLIVNLAHAVEPLSGKDKWKLAAVYAGKYGDA